MRATHLEHKCLIEFRIECLSVHFGFELLLLVGKQVNFNIRIGRSAHVESRQFLGLDDRDC
jgi:hypothetical protein